MVLTWDSSGNNDNVRALEGLLDTLSILWQVPVDLGDGGNVGQVGGHTGGVDDIVERELVDERAGLEEEGQWLADTARGTSDDCSNGQHEPRARADD